MARPRTPAHDYKVFTARLPPDILAFLRARAAVTGAPLNAELIRLVRLAIAMERDGAPSPPPEHDD